jgi:hypothetical protein
MLIGEVEIYVSFVLGGADVDYPFWAVALGPCFEHVERRPDLRCARGLPGRLVTPRDVDEHIARPRSAADGMAISILNSIGSRTFCWQVGVNSPQSQLDLDWGDCQSAGVCHRPCRLNAQPRNGRTKRRSPDGRLDHGPTSSSPAVAGNLPP